MKRALEHAGVDIDTVRPEDLERVLPNVRKALETFVPVADVARHFAEIERFLRDRASRVGQPANYGEHAGADEET
jgi:hypothetical protein